MDAPPPEPVPPPIEYQSDASLRAIRRGVRLMTVLTLLNTVLLGTSVFAPGITAFAKSQWASYQAARTARAQAAKDLVANAAMIVAQADAMRFALPADTLVFAEDFAATTLPLRATTSATLPATRRAAGEATAIASMPMPEPLRGLPRTLPGFGQIVRDAECYLFVHARRARPTADERLVLFSTNIEFTQWSPSRRLLAVVIEPAAADRAMRYCQYSAWELTVPKDAKAPARPLRFYAGQADANDGSRWAVAYEWGTDRGTITARLASDDRVDLVVDGALAPFAKQMNH